MEPVPEEALPPAEALGLAQRLLDAGRPFGAHEVLEAVWKAAPPGERDLWQGLAQLCVAATHHARGNARGAQRLRERGRERVTRGAQAAPPELDVTGVLGWHEGAPLRLLAPPRGHGHGAS